MANYLYNGVALPEIPEVAGYQYLIIFNFDTGIEFRAYQKTYQAGAPYYRNQDKGLHFPGTHKYFSLTDGSWVQNKSNSYAGLWAEHEHYERYKTPIWTNFTFKDDTGEVLCEASEPVPVLSIDHTAMVQGWIVGKRLAAMRKGKKPDEPAEPVPFVSRDGDTIILMGAYKATLTDGILEVV